MDSELSGHGVGVSLRGTVLRLGFDGTPRQRSSQFGHLGLGGRRDTLKRFSSCKRASSHLTAPNRTKWMNFKKHSGLCPTLCSQINALLMVQKGPLLMKISVRTSIFNSYWPLFSVLTVVISMGLFTMMQSSTKSPGDSGCPSLPSPWAGAGSRPTRRSGLVGDTQ